MAVLLKYLTEHKRELLSVNRASVPDGKKLFRYNTKFEVTDYLVYRDMYSQMLEFFQQETPAYKYTLKLIDFISKKSKKIKHPSVDIENFIAILHRDYPAVYQCLKCLIIFNHSYQKYKYIQPEVYNFICRHSERFIGLISKDPDERLLTLHKITMTIQLEKNKSSIEAARAQGLSHIMLPINFCPVSFSLKTASVGQTSIISTSRLPAVPNSGECSHRMLPATLNRESEQIIPQPAGDEQQIYERVQTAAAPIIPDGTKIEDSQSPVSPTQPAVVLMYKDREHFSVGQDFGDMPPAPCPLASCKSAIKLIPEDWRTNIGVTPGGP